MPVKNIIYIIEAYKFEAAVIFLLAFLMVILPLSSAISRVEAQSGIASAAVIQKLPLSHKPGFVTLDASGIAIAAAAPLPAASNANTVWPMHGIVTTEFGASDYPYQSHHTGIDISSAKPAGMSSVTPFRQGTVIAVVHSYASFGNHIIVDHGNGITSLYGHLYSTSVSVGQQVAPGSILGYEGSTGASTGPHLHFEVRQNGTPINPRQFFSSNP